MVSSLSFINPKLLNALAYCSLHSEKHIATRIPRDMETQAYFKGVYAGVLQLELLVLLSVNRWV